jgi:hypothetical protein
MPFFPAPPKENLQANCREIPGKNDPQKPGIRRFAAVISRFTLNLREVSALPRAA